MTTRWDNCIEACRDCAIECERCTDACLDEKDVTAKSRCIKLNRDCVAACMLAIRLMTSGSSFAEEFCRVCAEICQACADECAKHDTEHCKRCAEVCRRCAEECRSMAGAKAA